MAGNHCNYYSFGVLLMADGKNLKEVKNHETETYEKM